MDLGVDQHLLEGLDSMFMYEQEVRAGLIKALFAMLVMRYFLVQSSFLF